MCRNNNSDPLAKNVTITTYSFDMSLGICITSTSKQLDSFTQHTAPQLNLLHQIHTSLSPSLTSSTDFDPRYWIPLNQPHTYTLSGFHTSKSWSVGSSRPTHANLELNYCSSIQCTINWLRITLSVNIIFQMHFYSGNCTALILSSMNNICIKRSLPVPVIWIVDIPRV